MSKNVNSTQQAYAGINPNLRLSDEVKAALQDAMPVVALESTIITHGMPAPRNIETALQVEADVREAGAVPATIAVLDGTLHVGLDEVQLRRLSDTTDVMKLSRADLAACIALGRTGSTTVAATMLTAHLAGIRVFATGGIGGVHRGVADSMDISADLGEFSRTPVCVVCAGAKAILDLPATLEVLETLGVPVVGWRCDEIPAFWSRSSGLPSPLRFDTIEELGVFVRLRDKLQIDGGVLITNPVPETDEIPANVIHNVIEQALQDSSDAGIRGKQVTPFLLARVLELTGGRSLETNVALIRNNAKLAARLARQLTPDMFDRK